jgi:hypothetical protein
MFSDIPPFSDSSSFNPPSRVAEQPIGQKNIIASSSLAGAFNKPRFFDLRLAAPVVQREKTLPGSRHGRKSPEKIFLRCRRMAALEAGARRRPARCENR